MGVKKQDIYAYFAQAEKMIPWSLTVEKVSHDGRKYEDRFINVPSEQWDEAAENLTVRLLVKEHGFVIQDTIICETKTVFDPEIRLKNSRPLKKDKEETGFEIGCKFSIKSSGTRLEIISNNDGIILKYIDGEKLPVTTKITEIQKGLNLGTWIRI